LQSTTVPPARSPQRHHEIGWRWLFVLLDISGAWYDFGVSPFGGITQTQQNIARLQNEVARDQAGYAAVHANYVRLKQACREPISWC
jgi:hypothetical protein